MIEIEVGVTQYDRVRETIATMRQSGAAVAVLTRVGRDAKTPQGKPFRIEPLLVAGVLHELKVGRGIWTVNIGNLHYELAQGDRMGLYAQDEDALVDLSFLRLKGAADFVPPVSQRELDQAMRSAAQEFGHTSERTPS